MFASTANMDPNNANSFPWDDLKYVKGGRPSLQHQAIALEFFATWCPHCRKAVPAVSQSQRELSENGRVIAVASEPESAAKAFVHEFGDKIAYTVASDEMDVFEPIKTAHNVLGVPTVLVFGKDGKFLWKGHPGSDDYTRALHTAAGTEAPPATQAQQTEKRSETLSHSRLKNDTNNIMTWPVGGLSFVKGDRITDTSALQGKPIAIEFFSTTCGSCQKAVPHLSKARQDVGSGVLVLGVAREPTERVQQFAQDQGKAIDYMLAADPGNIMAPLWEGVTSVPHAMVFGTDGLLQWRGHPSTPEFQKALQQAAQQKQGGSTDSGSSIPITGLA